MKEKTKKFKFNIIDILLLLVVVAAVAVLGILFFSGNTATDLLSGNNPQEIYWEVELSKVREEFMDNIKEGDSVVDAVKLYSIGEVVSVSSVPTILNETNLQTGLIVSSVYPEHVNITVKVKANATQTETGYSIGGYEIAVGKQVSLRVPNYTGSGYCTGITVGDSAETSAD